MTIPKRLWRLPTAQAQDKLAKRFDLPNEPDMQDWEYEVADFKRVDEFLAAYESGGLSDDERFALMETILESFRGSGEIEEETSRWMHTLELIEENIELHIYTICYWACLGYKEEELEDAFEVAPAMREVLNRHKEQFSYPFPESAGEDL